MLVMYDTVGNAWKVFDSFLISFEIPYHLSKEITGVYISLQVMVCSLKDKYHVLIFKGKYHVLV